MGKIGVMELLLVLFIGLKITNNIDWSWWTVFIPFYARIFLSTAVFLLAAWKEHH